MKPFGLVLAASALFVSGCGSSPPAVKANPNTVVPPPAGSLWTVWHLGPTSPTSTIVTVIFDNNIKPDPPCSVPTKVIAHESATIVAIGLLAPVPGPGCFGAGLRNTFTVHLRAPLGSRRIVALTAG